MASTIAVISAVSLSVKSAILRGGEGGAALYGDRSRGLGSRRVWRLPTQGRCHG